MNNANEIKAGDKVTVSDKNLVTSFGKTGLVVRVWSDAKGNERCELRNGTAGWLKSVRTDAVTKAV